MVNTAGIGNAELKTTLPGYMQCRNIQLRSNVNWPTSSNRPEPESDLKPKQARKAKKLNQSNLSLYCTP